MSLDGVVEAVALIAVVSITFTGAVMQGTVGFGLALVVAPVLALRDPDLVPVVPILLAAPLAAVVAWQCRADVAVREISWAWLGRLPGTLLGAYLLSRLSGSALEAFFALLILSAVIIAAARGAPRQGRGVMFAAGFASGTMATAVSTGGPPMVLVMLDETPQRLRATLNAFFAVGAAVSLIALAAIGRTSSDQFGVAALLLPAVGFGLVVAERWGTRLPPAAVRSAALGLSGAAALILLASSAL